MSVRKPVLRVNPLTLVFTQAVVDKPCFRLLTVAQEYANTPVTIESDSPDLFLLATDNHPTFSPQLTFVPADEGTYVHIRYSSPKRTPSRAQLTITAPYDQQTVSLEGRTAGLLTSMQQVIPAYNAPRLTSGSKPASGKKWLVLAAAALVCGLGYTGFRYRCTLFPALCQSTSVEESIAPVHESAPVAAPATEQKPVTQPRVVSPSLPDKPVSRPAAEQLNTKSAAAVVAEGAVRPLRRKEVRQRKIESSELGAESELERELNGKP